MSTRTSLDTPAMPAALIWPDRLIAAVDQGLRRLRTPGRAALARRGPRRARAVGRRSGGRSAALMRVNHAGEMAAQALYHGQSLFARDRCDAASARERRARRTRSPRVVRRALESSAVARACSPVLVRGQLLHRRARGLRADAESLGFVRETERQVEAHLHDHLERLPPDDAKSARFCRGWPKTKRITARRRRSRRRRRVAAAIRGCMALGGEFCVELHLSVTCVAAAP